MSQRLPSETFVPPLPSFPVPVTPPALTSSPLVAVCIPENWMPYLRGALQQWIQASTWKGTPEEIQAVQAEAATIIALMTVECSTGSEYPTPFWDEATDVDDEAPAETQVWYGEVTNPTAAPEALTWQENVSIWLIDAFLVYSGEIGAAIAFNTIAPRFALALRKGDIREIWRIVVDAADVGYVDTDDYTDDIIEIKVAGDPENATHDVLIIKQAIP